MKSNFYTLIAGFLLAVASTLTVQAQTIRRVNNTGVTGTNIYTTLQAAHDAAASGDIIYLEPSSISYGNLTCVRPLTIIGNGYFLQQNPGLQLDTRDAIVGTIVFGNGSAGSRITGCVINGTMSIIASNITIERNDMSAIYFGFNAQSGATATVSNIIVRQNYVESALYVYPSGSNTVSNINISNNIIIGGITSSGSYTNMTSILITNNVLGNLAGTNGAGLQVDNAVIKNNILTSTSANTFTPRNNAYNNNISAGTQFGTANGNQQNIPPASVFVGGTASTDGAFQLRAAPNPAIGTGENGVNLGAFGGLVPYRIAGIPNVPTIYQYNQSVTGNTLNATISTRSNN